jgi:hypothetical protein
VPVKGKAGKKGVKDPVIMNETTEDGLIDTNGEAASGRK